MAGHAMKLGKLPAVKDDRDLHLSRYLKTSVLPRPPKSFGHDQAVHGWGMLGNDEYGCCVFAGAAHESMLWLASTGKFSAAFTRDSVLADYATVTGFDPDDPSTDRGTVVRDAMGYRRSKGIQDGRGGRHRIVAYTAIDPGDWTTMMTALYLFGAVGIGINFPESAMTQFNAGKAWTVVPGSPLEGGHYVPLVARRGMTRLVTWGKEISASKDFLLRYCDEAYACVTDEALRNGRSLEGFDTRALLADLKAVTR